VPIQAEDEAFDLGTGRVDERGLPGSKRLRVAVHGPAASSLRVTR